MVGLSLTHPVLLACQVLQQGSPNLHLCEQALRHLLIVDTIQHNQVVDLILGNPALLDAFCRVGNTEPVPGYWHHLLSVIVRSRRIDAHKESSLQVSNLITKQYRSVMGRVSESEPLNQ